jgi:hypothetical protein
MEETKIKWKEGEGYITATYEGSGSGSASISSDINEGIDREQFINVETIKGSNPKVASVNVMQIGMREVFLPNDGDFILADGGTFNVLKSKYPNGFKEVEYIEVDGHRYFDTGFKPNQNTRVVVDFHANDASKHVWGSRIEWRNNSFLCCWETNFDWCVQINAANFNGGSFDARARHIVEMSCSEFKVDGSTTATYSVDVFQCQNPLLIASVQNSEQSENFIGEIYSFKIYDNNVLMHDYVPLMNSDGVSCFYDLINNVFINPIIV